MKYIYLLLAWFLVVGTLAVLAGCSTAGNPMNEVLLPKTDVYYYNDINLDINGKKCTGVCAIAKAPSYAIKIETKEEVDQIIVRTLKRTDTPAPDTLGKKKKGYVYNYTPGTIEKEPGTKLKISAYVKDKGMNSSGLVVFEHDYYQLTAGVSCNAAADYGAKGVAVCQAMKGQRMRIWFPRAVLISPRKILKAESAPGETDEDRRCQIAKSKDNLTFEFDLPTRECEYYFATEKEPIERFVLYTVGAEEMPIRGE